MKYSFKDVFLSILYKNNNEQILSLLRSHNKILEKTKYESITKLNRLKYICLNSNNLDEVFSNDLTSLCLDKSIDDALLEDIHMANINYPSDDKIIEQLFISNKLIQCIDKNCIIFNKYINIIKDLKKFTKEANVDTTILTSPFFQFSKDKKGYPMAFICPIDKNYFITGNYNFKIYGFFGKYEDLSKKGGYMELNLKYNEIIPSSLEVKNFYLGNNSNLEFGNKALIYLIDKLIPEFNNLFKNTNNNIKLKNNFKTKVIYGCNTQKSNLEFYKKNGFTLKEDKFYLNLY